MSTEKDTVLTTNTIVVDLGKRESRLVRQLKLGKGELLDEVKEIVDEVSEQIKPADDGKERVYIPVVVILEH
jgi:hypothetical protein